MSPAGVSGGNPSSMGRPETIEETAELVTRQGGRGIAVQVDHTVEQDVKRLFERVKEEQQGQLDILVNGVWGGDSLTEWGQPFWKHNLHNGRIMQERAVHSHMITSHYGVPLMVERGQGLVVEITDGVGYDYRGNLFYSLAKISTRPGDGPGSEQSTESRLWLSPPAFCAQRPCWICSG